MIPHAKYDLQDTYSHSLSPFGLGFSWTSDQLTLPSPVSLSHWHWIEQERQDDSKDVGAGYLFSSCKLPSNMKQHLQHSSARDAWLDIINPTDITLPECVLHPSRLQAQPSAVLRKYKCSISLGTTHTALHHALWVRSLLVLESDLDLFLKNILHLWHCKATNELY